MRTLFTFFLLFCFSGLIAQTAEKKITGTWRLRIHIVEGDTCILDSLDITFNEDKTFTESYNWTDKYGKKYAENGKGKWEIKGDSITYYRHYLNPNYGDQTFEFSFNSQGELVQKDYVCSEILGTSYYRRKKIPGHHL